MPSARLIIDPPAAGGWNMAVDEVLLETAAESDQITLRFYEWTPATLSLGYFQGHAERLAHAPSRACPLVRRSTGGGAIVHDHELTYSLIAPVRGRFGSAASQLYDAVHGSLVKTLTNLGLQATLYTSTQRSEGVSPPFLCFERRAGGDVVVDGQKVAGSAQRRHRGTVLQHGSILLRQSAAAPELPGISELLGRTVSTPEWIALWSGELFSRLEVQVNERPLNTAEHALAKTAQELKFATPAWTCKR